MAWSKPPQQSGTSSPHPAGVETTLIADGCVYTTEAIALSGTGTLSLSNATDLSEQTSVVVEKGVIAEPSGSLQAWQMLSNRDGKFSVKVKLPGSEEPVAGKGVYLPGQRRAWGYFPSGAIGGRIELTVPPPAMPGAPW